MMESSGSISVDAYGEVKVVRLVGEHDISTAVTNSVIHSGRPDGDPISFSSDVADGVLRVEVGDEGRGVASLSARSLDPPSGLGYLDLLSDRWSSRQDGTFHVWFEIDVVSHTTFSRAAPV